MAILKIYDKHREEIEDTGLPNLCYEFDLLERMKEKAPKKVIHQMIKKRMEKIKSEYEKDSECWCSVKEKEYCLKEKAETAKVE